MGVGVDRHDVVGLSESAGVLHRTRDAERHVEPRIHHHSGGAYLALVGQPALVGDDPCRADRGIQRVGQVSESPEPLLGGQSVAPGNDPRRFGQVHGGGIGWQNLHGSRFGQVGFIEVNPGHPGGFRTVIDRGVDSAYAGLESDDGCAVEMVLEHGGAPVVGGVDRPVADVQRSAQQVVAGHHRDPWGEVPSVGACGKEHDRLGAQQSRRGSRPSSGVESVGLPDGDLTGQRSQVCHSFLGALTDQQRTAPGLGHRLGPTGRKYSRTNGNHCDHRGNATAADRPDHSPSGATDGSRWRPVARW